jgi:sec-independent protein translocase protein TatA
MLPNLGPTELIIILVIVLIIFGAGRLAGIGGALGKSVKEFKEATKEDKPAEAEKKPEPVSAEEPKA